MASQLRHHTNGQAEVCEELYTQEILLPRVATMLLVLTAGVVIVLSVQKHQRRRRRLAIITTNGSPPPPCEENASSVRSDLLQSRLRLAVFAGIVWTSILFLSFQTYDSRSRLMETVSPGRPRMVFSFTTTAENIEKIEPTLAALVNQRSDTFDAIYVVVPREYRGEEVQIPAWLVAADNASNKTADDFYGWKYSLTPSTYHDGVHVLVIDKTTASTLLSSPLVLYTTRPSFPTKRWPCWAAGSVQRTRCTVDAV